MLRSTALCLCSVAVFLAACGKSEPTKPSPGATGASASWQFFEARKGERVKMISKDEGFCALVGVGGAFQGGGESAEVAIDDKDGYWYLECKAGSKFLSARAIAVRINPATTAQNEAAK